MDQINRQLVFQSTEAAAMTITNKPNNIQVYL